MPEQPLTPRLCENIIVTELSSCANFKQTDFHVK